VIWIFILFVELGPFFFPWKILWISWNHNVQVESLPIKRKATIPIQISISCFYTGIRLKCLFWQFLGASTLLRFWILMLIWVATHWIQEIVLI
jgi:hypothetical protein